MLPSHTDSLTFPLQCNHRWSPIEPPSPVQQFNDLYPYLNVDVHTPLIITVSTASEEIERPSSAIIIACCMVERFRETVYGPLENGAVDSIGKK
jgi:hypothetical protein